MTCCSQPCASVVVHSVRWKRNVKVMVSSCCSCSCVPWSSTYNSSSTAGPVRGPSRLSGTSLSGPAPDETELSLNLSPVAACSCTQRGRKSCGILISFFLSLSSQVWKRKTGVTSVPLPAAHVHPRVAPALWPHNIAGGQAWHEQEGNYSAGGISFLKMDQAAWCGEVHTITASF